MREAHLEMGSRSLPAICRRPWVLEQLGLDKKGLARGVSAAWLRGLQVRCGIRELRDQTGVAAVLEIPFIMV